MILSTLSSLIGMSGDGHSGQAAMSPIFDTHRDFFSPIGLC